MQIVATVLLVFAIILVAAAAFGHTSAGGVQTFPAGMTLYLLSLLAARFGMP